jgi:hypothetical protein
VGLTLFVGILVIGALIFPLVGVLFFTGDSEEANAPGYRVRRVIGFAIVAAGVSILFLIVTSASGIFSPHPVDCGSAWQAMFSKDSNWTGYACGRASIPYLSIAAGVAAVGMGVAFWGAGRGRLLAAVCLPFAAALSVYVIGLAASSQMYRGD